MAHSSPDLSYKIPVPKKEPQSLPKMAEAAAKIWIKCGALEYVETLADDVSKGKIIPPFPRSVILKTASQ
jgi:uncharacterized protein YbaA (DUF1428 family)